MIFTKFSDSDVVLGRTSQVSSGFWSDGNYAHSQSALYTSSTQIRITGSNGSTDIKNGLYYWDVYQADPSANTSAQVHFSVTFGDYYGSGSGAADTASLAKPTKAIYSQYKNYLLTPGDDLFSFKTGSYIDNGTITDSTSTITGSSIYVIHFSTALFKDKTDEGQLQFSLSGSSGKMTFIDDSSIINSKQDVYNIISGSVIDGVPTPVYSGSAINYHSIGLFYPKNGVVVLNAAALNTRLGITYNLSNSGNYKVNHQYIFSALKVCATDTMKVRKSEFLPSRHYFINVKNKEYNYSNNPTFVNDGTSGTEKGTIKINEFLTDPKTYVTTVGLYDDTNELVAVAKLSQPLMKSFNDELNIKCRLDF